MNTDVHCPDCGALTRKTQDDGFEVLVCTNDYCERVTVAVVPVPAVSDFDSLREDFAGAFTAINDYAQAQRRHAEAVSAEVERLWSDNAALRDELHALANRVEGLTRAVTTEPAETAARMVDGRQS